MGFILMKTSVSMCANIETGGRIGEEFNLCIDFMKHQSVPAFPIIPTKTDEKYPNFLV